LVTIIAVMGMLSVAVGSAIATQPPAKSSTLLAATGTVTALDLSRIAVGRTKCALGAKSAGLAGSFAIGEHVTIGCVSGVLRTIKLAPVTSGQLHSVVVIRSAPVIPKASGPSGPSSKASVSWTSGTIVPGNSSANAGTSNLPPTSANATGPIASLDPTGITIGDATCPFFGSDLTSASHQALIEKLSTSSGSLYYFLTQTMHVQVGDIAQFSCTYSVGASSGRVTIG
jgi:hypothetical protein